MDSGVRGRCRSLRRAFGKQLTDEGHEEFRLIGIGRPSISARCAAPPPAVIAVPGPAEAVGERSSSTGVSGRRETPAGFLVLRTDV